MPRSAFRPVATAGLIVLMLAACSRQNEAPSAPQSTQPVTAADQTPVQGDWVVQRIDSEPDSLNPIILESTNGQAIDWIVINEGLLRINNYTLKLEGCLAESWEVSPDQLTYTFHLHHGVRWHDGQPFTADDVKFTYDKMQDPKVDAASIRSYFTTIKSCEVLDPYTVRFTATQRYFKTLESLGTLLNIVPRHAFDKGDPDFNKNAFSRAPIGTGPYKFVSWETGSQIVLERNDDYWGGPIHYPKRLVYRVLQEPSIATQLLKKGEIDALDRVSPILWEHDLAPSPSMSRLREIVYQFPAYNYMGFNLREPIFSDVRVRHAIDLLMPREKIISQVYLNKYATLCSGYDPPSSRNYNHDVPPTPYDPKLAIQLLNEAGWKIDPSDGLLHKDGKAFTFTLVYGSGNPIAQKIAELTQESLAQAGIRMDLSGLEFAQMISRLNDWKFDATILSWSLDLNGDPAQLWLGSDADVKKSSNFIGYKSAEADKLIAAGKLEYDDEKRAVIYRQLHKLIHDDYPVSFLVNPSEILVISNRFQNANIFAPVPCFDITTWWTPRGLQKYGN